MPNPEWDNHRHESLAAQQERVRAQFVELCKEVLLVFNTDDYRTTVRGAIPFEVTIRRTDV